jgi:hypothetical protein
VKTISVSAEPQGELELDSMFKEWREREAHRNALRASDDDVVGLFREALAGLGGSSDFGVSVDVGEAQSALDALGQVRTEA